VFLAFGAKIPSAMSTEHQDSSRNVPTAAKILWSFRPAIDGAFTVAGIAITALVISFIQGLLDFKIHELVWIAAILFVFGIKIVNRMPDPKPPWEEKA
jgi:type IV secretory pathway VirB2 component (pilin)